VTNTLSVPIDRSPSTIGSGSTWGALRRVVFRFGFVYWLLFCIPMITTQVSGLDWIGEDYSGSWNTFVAWVAKHVLHIGHELILATNGSGDKTGDYVALLCYAAIALLASVVWSLLDSRRLEHDRLLAIRRVILRYSLAFVMLGYGLVKVFAGQFSPPSSYRLLQPYGESSPMGLLWTFMGASPAYVVFSGCAETLGAVLLLFRRTTTLGALVLGAVLTNVVMLNFCYDVPVKINSSHYLAICVLLLLPSARRLVDVLVLERAAAPVPPPPPLPRRWMRNARRIGKYAGIALVLTLTIVDIRKSAAEEAAVPEHWFEGVWTVETFARDGQGTLALLPDATRWKRVKLDSANDKVYVRWRFVNDAVGPLYTAVIDDTKQTMVLTPVGPPSNSDPRALHFVRDGIDRWTIHGVIGGAGEVVVSLRRIAFDKMLLRSRGFHWINEVPFNR
jgi:hypothetical protein